jgi:hypothetical protein
VDNTGDDASGYGQIGAQVLEFQCLLKICADEAPDYLGHFYVMPRRLTPVNDSGWLWAEICSAAKNGNAKGDISDKMPCPPEVGVRLNSGLPEQAPAVGGMGGCFEDSADLRDAPVKFWTH